MKSFIFSLLFIFSIGSLHAQTDNYGQINKIEKLIWLGVDCSLIQCVGPSQFKSPEYVASYLAGAWNEIFLTEHDKYDVHGALRKDDFHFDLSAVEKINETMDLGKIMIFEAQPLTQDQIDEAIQAYYTDEFDSGYGIIYLVEELNSVTEQSKVHVVIFDIQTYIIVYQHLYEGEAGGSSYRNFWANSFADITERMGKNYSKWRKKNK